MTGRLLAAAVGLTAFAGGADGAPAASVCGPATARTEAQSDVARVFRETRHGYAYSCVADRRGARRIPMWAPSQLSPAGIGPFAVEGTTAAYGAMADARIDWWARVLVRDLRTGERLRSIRAFSPTPNLAPSLSPTPYGVRSVVVWAETLSVAYIVANPYADDGTFEVWRAEGAADEPTRLDAGDAIAPRSLRLKGTTLRWRNGGAWRTATLDAPPATLPPAPR
ncbi:MAG TPA: hypothetical protein VIL49_01395 [Capillimicrobium sp.]